MENFLDQKVLKELAYASKIKTQLPGKVKELKYNYILIPILNKPLNLPEKMILLQETLFEKINSVINISNDIIYSLASIFSQGNYIVLNKIFLEISIFAEINDSKIDITYTDGSFKKDRNEASYSTVKLLQEDPNGVLDEFTNKKFIYQGLSGRIQNGTNNIGELTGIKTAVENFGDKKYQLIISDSEYGVKVFREWYYTWKNNNFKNYAKKEVANKELIQEIYNLLKSANKIILFKWTKGHNDNSFNEICDELAKNILKDEKE
jgi:ribonuclease HI